MTDLDHWDIILLVLAAFVAVTTLVRLMLARRDSLLGEVRQQLTAAKSKRQHGKQQPKKTP